MFGMIQKDATVKKIFIPAKSVDILLLFQQYATNAVVTIAGPTDVII